MRAAALYKWARDVGGAAVHGDGTVVWRSTKMVAGEDDHAALAAACDLAGPTGEVVGVTIGDGDTSWALARGAARVVSVTDAPALVDETVTAAVLAAAVRSVGDVDVVLVGDAEEHPGVGVAVAARLGWPVLAGVLSASAADGRVVAVRRSGDVEETLSVATPAVLVVAARSAEAKAPGMKELLAARKRPVAATTLGELGVTAEDAVVSRSTRLPQTTAARLFDGDPAQAARSLVDALRAEGVLS